MRSGPWYIQIQPIINAVVLICKPKNGVFEICTEIQYWLSSMLKSLFFFFHKSLQHVCPPVFLPSTKISWAFKSKKAFASDNSFLIFLDEQY